MSGVTSNVSGDTGGGYKEVIKYTTDVNGNVKAEVVEEPTGEGSGSNNRANTNNSSTTDNGVLNNSRLTAIVAQKDCI